MTDRSNYGPVRRLSPSVSTDSRKPYSRTGLKGVLGTVDLNSGDTAVPTPPDSPYYPFHVETPQLEPPSQNRSGVPDGPRDVAGFPTYEQYQRIEEEYLTSLSERKQPKALISQALFDKIFAVLQNGSEDRASTAQFRFWVRKMFVLAYPQTSFAHNAGQTTPEPVVLHDKRPVAIREQLYEVLCYCHAVARHGGRDKTCATLRINYSWVPKELTAKFVKACPTCTLKRSGNPDFLSQFGQAVPPSYAQAVPAEHAPRFPGGPNDSPPDPNFALRSEGRDDGSGTSFGPSSIFATPDLSAYPSPTLSAGSLGPTTPSPYLHSGLFGYPVMFDPGHGSISSMAGWDPSPLSPCGLMYADELRTGFPKQHRLLISAEEIIDTCARGMQLQMPTPKVARTFCKRAHNGEDDDGCSADPLPRIEGTLCPADISHIDPALLGYPSYVLDGSGAGDTEAEVDHGPGEGGGSGGPYRLNTASSTSPSSNGGCPVLQQQQPLPPPAQFGLALSATSHAMGSSMDGGAGVGAGYPMSEPASTLGPRQRRRQRQRRLPPAPQEASVTDACSYGSGGVLLSLPPHPTSAPLSRPRGGSTMMSMMMYTPPISMSAAAALGMGVGGGIMLCGRDEDAQERKHEREDAKGFEREMCVVEGRDVLVPVDASDGEEAHRHRMEGEARWDSPEAWLVQSDSFDEASDAVV